MALGQLHSEQTYKHEYGVHAVTHCTAMCSAAWCKATLVGVSVLVNLIPSAASVGIYYQLGKESTSPYKLSRVSTNGREVNTVLWPRKHKQNQHQLNLPAICLLFLHFVPRAPAAPCGVTAGDAGKSYPREILWTFVIMYWKSYLKCFLLLSLQINKKAICKIFNTLFSPELTKMTAPYDTTYE